MKTKILTITPQEIQQATELSSLAVLMAATSLNPYAMKGAAEKAWSDGFRGKPLEGTSQGSMLGQVHQEGVRAVLAYMEGVMAGRRGSGRLFDEKAAVASFYLNQEDLETLRGSDAQEKSVALFKVHEAGRVACVALEAVSTDSAG